MPVITQAGFLAMSGSLVLFAQSAATTVDDGPYVFWEPDGRARVVALCAGEKDERVITAGDGFVLNVPCLGLAAVRVSADPPVPPASEHADVSRIFAVGDVHGEYEAAVELLQAGRVIDDDRRWSFGDGHVVFNGDVFDRGDRVTEMLWLIYRLEQEATAAGGRVHMILGNHEVMVLRGDLRYVDGKYLHGTAPALGLTYDEIFGPTSELGRWLRTRNTIVRINGLVFVHGGVSPEVARLELSLGQLNEAIRRNLDAAKDTMSPDDQMLFGSLGLLWYRGYFMALQNYDATSPEEIRFIIDRLDAERVVVAHTHVEMVSAHHGGLVIGIDVLMTEDNAEGLLWQDDEYYRVGRDGTRTRLQLD